MGFISNPTPSGPSMFASALYHGLFLFSVKNLLLCVLLYVVLFLSKIDLSLGPFYFFFKALSFIGGGHGHRQTVLENISEIFRRG